MISTTQNQKKRIYALVSLIILLVFAFSNINLSRTPEVYQQTNHDRPSSSSWAETTIYINDAASNDWAYTVANEDWCSGSGTYADPYTIQNVSVYNPAGYAIRIMNSRGVYFKIQNCTAQELVDSASYGAITISNSENGQIIANNISNNLGCGIFFDDCDNMTISDNILNNNGFHGMLLSGLSASCDYNTISGNTLINNSLLAIYLNFNNTNNLITENVINGLGFQQDGIALSNYGTNNTILDNQIYDITRIGINCGYQSSGNSHNNTLIQGNTIERCFRGVHFETNGFHNQFIDNTFDEISLVGIWVTGDNTNTIQYTLISDNSFTDCRFAIGVERYTANSLIEKNHIWNSTSCGINLYTLSSNNTVYNNEITLCKQGIWLQYSDIAHPIVNNTICNCTEYGIYGYLCTSQIIADNFFAYNNLSAIYLWVATGNVITGNMLTRNLQDAITVVDSAENTIAGNKITQNTRYGIFLNESTSDRVVANMIYDNNAAGIFIDSCNGTVVHDNLLGGNAACISFEDCTGLHVYNNTCLLGDNESLSVTSLLDALSNPEGWIIGGVGLGIGAIVVAIIRGRGKKKKPKKK